MAQLKRIALLAAAVTAMVQSTESFAADRQDTKRNVLFIAVDDLRPELGCYGKTYIKSPNIDRLAEAGVLFKRAYCQQAVCGATRTSLLTGLRPDTVRVHGNTVHFRKTVPDIVTLPQHFKNHGYHVQGMGKIYHQDDPPSWSVPLERPPAMVWLRPENSAATVAKRGPPTEFADVDDNAYPEGKIAELAVDAMRKNKDRPFFLAVGFVRPHLPFNCPKKYWDLYDRSEVELPKPIRPKGAPNYALTSWGELRKYRGIPSKGPVSEKQALDLIHGYRACVTYVDAQVGRVIDELDRLGLREKTVIILWGDHGWKLGDYGCWCKHTNFELDVHVPMIVHAPGAKGNGRATDALAEFVDIYPSLCELAGLPLPDHLEGTSFAPLLQDPDRPWKKAAMSQYPRGKLMGYSMRTDRYRYTRWCDRKDPEKVAAMELYDHEKDPGETVNVVGNPEYADIAKKLESQLDAGWRAARPK